MEFKGETYVFGRGKSSYLIPMKLSDSISYDLYVKAGDYYYEV